MSVRNLARMFGPAHVAIVGAGGEPDQLGHLVLRNLLDGSFDGVVYPVNPHREAVGGVRAYPGIADTPHPPDLVVVCTPAAAVPGVVRECGTAGVPAVAVLSSGFRETGPQGQALERAVGEELRRHPGMRLLGPNCLGLIVPRLGLNASFGPIMPAAGHVAFVSQSGALATAVIDWAASEQIGFSQVVSAGNMLDVDLGDLIDYLGQDSHTRSIVLYLETVTEPRKFMSAARAFARTKPIIVYKAGKFAASAHAAVSHTGAMAGADAVCDAALRRGGMVRVDRIEDIFATAELLARERPMLRASLAIVTNAGGPGVMATDALLTRGGELARLQPATIEALDRALPAAWSHGNPVDLLGDAPASRYADAVAITLADSGVDAVLVILTPQAMTDPAATAEAVLAARRAAQYRKPVLAAWMGGHTVQDGLARLRAGGVAAYAYPEQPVEALANLVGHARTLATLHETPRSIPLSFALDRRRARELMSPVFAEGSGVLSETSAKALLEAYEIPVTRPLPALSAPQAPVRGVTVQPMARAAGYELVLGARKDPVFGAVLLVGAGGVAAEVLRDQALGLPPLNERLALGMLQRLRIWPLLAGHRARPAIDLDALLQVVMRFSYLVADYPEISEIEINPLLAAAAGAIALDARGVVDQSLVGRQLAPFSHLAIRPYPEEFTREVTTGKGLAVTLRAIRPEDEPAWHAMLDACSPESIAMRFQGMVRHTHEFATRYCFIDYDRELAIVAELLSGEDAGRLAGVGRLVADPDRQQAEYAVLVADPWQRRGLGTLLTAYCLDLARAWGLRSVYAETTPDNLRVLPVLRKQGFKLTPRPDQGIVFAERPL